MSGLLHKIARPIQLYPAHGVWQNHAFLLALAYKDQMSMEGSPSQLDEGTLSILLETWVGFRPNILTAAAILIILHVDSRNLDPSFSALIRSFQHRLVGSNPKNLGS